MAEDDLELRRLQLRRLMRMALAAESKKPAEPERREPTADEIVRSRLGERGEEVLNAAYEQYPEATAKIVEQLAKLIKEGQIDTVIDGYMLYSLFRNLGLRVRIETRIKYLKRGEVKDLSEFFRQKL
ncbi:hypothetical protein HRbin01_00532 [archaeon HR01]|nr:hypothetical protein HRbin01_00532 [archaeon HR01]